MNYAIGDQVWMVVQHSNGLFVGVGTNVKSVTDTQVTVGGLVASEFVLTRSGEHEPWKCVEPLVVEGNSCEIYMISKLPSGVRSWGSWDLGVPGAMWNGTLTTSTDTPRDTSKEDASFGWWQG
jgi:hypothetical protein